MKKFNLTISEVLMQVFRNDSIEELEAEYKDGKIILDYNDLHDIYIQSSSDEIVFPIVKEDNLKLMEILSKDIIVEADTLEEAIHIGYDKYFSEEIILDESDFKEYKIL